MAEKRKDPYNWETIWDDSEKHIDNHALNSIEYDEKKNKIKFDKAGYVSVMPPKKALEIIKEKQFDE